MSAVKINKSCVTNDFKELESILDKLVSKEGIGPISINGIIVPGDVKGAKESRLNVSWEQDEEL